MHQTFRCEIDKETEVDRLNPHHKWLFFAFQKCSFSPIFGNITFGGNAQTDKMLAKLIKNVNAKL